MDAELIRRRFDPLFSLEAKYPPGAGEATRRAIDEGRGGSSSRSATWSRTTPEDKDYRRIASMEQRATRAASRLPPGRARDAAFDEHMEAAAGRMARAIGDADKAVRRARAAEDDNFHAVAKIFFARYAELRGGAAAAAEGDRRNAERAAMPINERWSPATRARMQETGDNRRGVLAPWRPDLSEFLGTVESLIRQRFDPLFALEAKYPHGAGEATRRAIDEGRAPGKGGLTLKPGFTTGMSSDEADMHALAIGGVNELDGGDPGNSIPDTIEVHGGNEDAHNALASAWRDRGDDTVAALHDKAEAANRDARHAWRDVEELKHANKKAKTISRAESAAYKATTAATKSSSAAIRQSEKVLMDVHGDERD